MTEARVLYEKGDFPGALEKYQQIIDAEPKSPDAYAGVIRTYLKMKDVSRASETATKALEASDSVPVHVALGEVYFRQGRIGDAEAEWVKVVNSGRQDAHAYLGLARVRWAISMYKSGWNMIEMAHALDPSDPDIRRAWMQKLGTKDRIQFLKEYLAGDNNDDEETRTSMRHYLEFLEARSKDTRGGCRLVSKSTATETPLERLLIDPSHLRGYGLNVEVNGPKTRLMLDTGASGILINRSLAEKAGVTRLADLDVGGIGDKGMKSGYRALAGSFTVGGLEFRNCTVQVLDKRSVVGAFAGGLSSALDVPRRPFSIKRIGQWRHHASIFGVPGSATRHENDPFVLIRSADPEKTPHFFLTCGDNEGLLPVNRSFAKLLQERGFRFEFHVVPGGHEWNQWNARLNDLFLSLRQHLGVRKND